MDTEIGMACAEMNFYLLINNTADADKDQEKKLKCSRSFTNFLQREIEGEIVLCHGVWVMGYVTTSMNISSIGNLRNLCYA